MHLFCFGTGYVGLNWLKAAPQQAQKSGTTRDLEKVSTLRQNGIHGYLYGEDSIDFQDVTHILISIPPGKQGDTVLQDYATHLIQTPNLKWVGLLSSTGVYGDHGGTWVDESSPCRPTSEKTRARLTAESQWLTFVETHNLPVHVFRLSGIYGPGRSLVKRVQGGELHRIHKPGHKFSRIHVDDICQTLYQSMAAPRPGSLYNLADDHPAETREVIEYICEQMEIPLPPLVDFEQAKLSPQAQQFYKDNKLIANHKIKSELEVRLQYPSYREGLQEEISAGR